MSELTIYDKARADLCCFLHAYNLLDLQELLLGKGVELHDVLQMDSDEMEDIGIKVYKLRKRL